MSDVDLVPSTPDPTYVAIVAAAIRGAVQFLTGIGFLGAAYTDSQIMMAATSAVLLGTLAWSAYQKLRQAKKSHDSSMESAKRSAVASADAGTPIAITVTDSQVSRLP